MDASLSRHPVSLAARSGRVAALVLAAALGSTVVAAQDTRESQITALQAAKSTQLGSEEPDRVERVIVTVMKSPLLTGGGGVYPWFGSVYQGTGFGIGAGYTKNLVHASKLTAVAGLSFNRSSRVSMDYVAPTFFRKRVAPFVGLSWVRAKDISFYGVGNDSPKSHRVGYDLDPSTVRAGAAVTATPWLSFEAAYQFSALELNVRDAAADPRDLAALASGVRLNFSGTRVGATIDTRPSAGYSTHGSMVRAVSSYYSERNDRPFEFRQSTFEAVHLVPLVREEFVLAFRGLLTVTQPDNGNGVPLQMLPYLGSGDTLRAFINRRFVDRDLFLLTGEYRWRPSRFIDLALFVDAGQVAPSTKAIEWNRMKTSWGGGVRFHGPSFSALRLEVAHGAEGYRLVFDTGMPF
jgi:hypothetical protein